MRHMDSSEMLYYPLVPAESAVHSKASISDVKLMINAAILYVNIFQILFTNATNLAFRLLRLMTKSYQNELFS